MEARVTVKCTSCKEEYKITRSAMNKRTRGRYTTCQPCTTSIRNGDQKGKNNPNWKGGRTPEIQKFYNSPEWKELRTKVFVRDNYTCRDCAKHGGYLEANHIKARSRYPDLKLVASNIETLCKPCHDKKKWQVYSPLV